MPIYEYTCRSGHQFEELTFKRDAAHTLCPACGAEATRQLSAPSPTPGADFSQLAGGCGREACMTGGCQGLFGGSAEKGRV